MELKYLHQNGAYVKKFVLRSESYDKVVAGTVIIKDTLPKLNGYLMFEKQVSQRANFIIISFQDRVNMIAWESMVSSSIEAKMIDVVSSKVLHIIDNNDTEAMKKTEEIKASLYDYEAAVLQENRLKEGQYELLLFFINEEKMHQWESTFGIQV